MTAPIDPGLYDLFVSYSNRDDVISPGGHEGWVQAFIRRILALAVPYTAANLSTPISREPDWNTFYAPDAIAPGQIWETRLRSAVAHSRVLLACISENYWESRWCRIEWETYLGQESARGLANVEGGITPVYTATAPGTNTRSIIEKAPPWARDLLNKRQIQLLEFQTHGLDAITRLRALHDDPVTGQCLERIAVRVSDQIARARWAENAEWKGNISGATGTFVGRGIELAQIEEQMFQGGALGVITALRGLGGQGKTALALRYGRNLRTRYSGGCWEVGAEGQSELLPLLATLREPLGLQPVGTETDENTARRVLTELHRRAFDPAFPRDLGQSAAALLVVDNVDDPRLLAATQRDALRKATLAAGTGGMGWLHILATTRLEGRDLTFLDNKQIITVDALPEADALKLWCRILFGRDDMQSGTEVAAAKEIIGLLERHTLAVEVAARFVRLYADEGETANTYRTRLSRAMGSGTGEMGKKLVEAQQEQQARDLLPGYAHGLESTLRFTFDRLSQNHPSAATVLNYAAHFPTEAVPLPWLRFLAGQHHAELLEPTNAGIPGPWDSIILRLTGSLRLLTPSEATIPEVARLHRLTGEFLRKGAQKENEDAARVFAVEAFIEKRCTFAETDHLIALAPWERRVLAADLTVRLALKDCTHPMAVSGLFLGQILTDYAELATAARLYTAANAVLHRLAQSDPANDGLQRDLSVSLEKLGALAVAQGDLPRALGYFTQYKNIAERLARSDPANDGWRRDFAVSLEKLGDLAVAQGDLPGALCNLTKARDLAEVLVQSDPARAAWQIHLSVSISKLGDLAIAQGDLPGALSHFTQGKDIAERLVQKDPTHSGWQRHLSMSLGKLGDIAMAEGDVPGALRYFTQAKDIAERLAQSDPAHAGWQHEFSVSLTKFGNLAMARGDVASALRYFTDSKVILERLTRIDPDNSQWQRDLSMSLNRLGDLAVAQGDLASARRSFTQAQVITERLARSDPTNSGWQRDLSISLEKIGDIAVALGDLHGALPSFTEAKKIAERLAQDDPTNAGWQRDISVSLNKLGEIAVAQGDLSGALRHFTECMTVREHLAARDPANTALQRDLWISNGKLGDLSTVQGDVPAAIRFWKKANEITFRLAAYDPKNLLWQRDLSISLEKLGNLSMDQSNLVGAQRSFTECNTIRNRLAQRDPANAGWQRDLFVSHGKLGDVAMAQDDLATALRSFTEAMIIIERLAQSDPDNAEWQRDIVVSHVRLYQLARKKGDGVLADGEQRACFVVLDRMKQRGMHLDSPMAQLHSKLARLFSKL